MNDETKPDSKTNADEAFRFCAGFNPEDIPKILEAMRENDKEEFIPYRIKAPKQQEGERGKRV